MFERDADESVPARVIRWAFRLAMPGVFLVWILGRSSVVIAGILLILLLFLLSFFSLGLARIERLNDMVGTPVSFCLPGFRDSLRRRYFNSALLMGLSVSLYPLAGALLVQSRYSSLADIDPLQIGLSMVAAFLLGMLLALILGTPRLILSRLAWNLLMLLSVPLFLGAIVAFSAFVEYPFIGIPVCAAVCIFVWSRLGDMARVRQGHRMIIEDALERRAQIGVKKTAPPWVESVFRRPMEHRGYLTAGRYLWGGLYEAFGSLLSSWKWLVPGVIVGALVLASIGSGVVAIVALAIVSFAVQSLRLPVTSTLLLPAGRREKCHATLAIAVAASLLLIVAAAVVVVLSRVVPVGSAFGSFQIGARDWSLETIGPAGLFLACLLVPTLLGIQLLYQEGRGSGWIVWTLLLGSLLLIFLWPGTWPAWLRLALFTALLALGWVFFLLVLRTACRRWDLG